ncbi:uncharacterized protein EHS24_004728 [Apiotrichum porosum]|uniref:Major facilitator superfamily (MFS) profile domain-containing protein n=1 Tax=Apiotrichum porosum TaxID=105984 RepID=A0A427Y5Y0_9TREE|nr:uncharacterized protein EHS24_004728 [Apiotrichum porosum]RSH86472.1 hypothetical protein EHS24_004728 [Apiotrichum porosum]
MSPLPDLEKPVTSHIEDKNDIGIRLAKLDDAELDTAERHIRDADTYTDEQYARVRRKMDFIQLFADKQSLANGVLFGLREDTKLVGNEYANLTTFFFMAYAIGQLPMGWLCQRFPIAKVIATCVILWGITVMCMGAAHNYAQLAALRVLLGLFESTIRQVCYYTMSTFITVISNVIIYYLALHVQTHGGIAAWRVINLFLGGLTVFIGILNLLVWGTPENAWWLTKEEKNIARSRIVSNATGGGESHPWKWDQIRECFKDPQYYFFMLFNILITIPNGGVTTFAPLVFVSFGFSPLNTVLYALPQQAIGFFFLLVPGNIVNIFPRARFPFVILITAFCCACLLSVGLMKGTADNKWTRWALFSFCSTYSCAMYLTWPLMSINVAGRTKKTWISGTALMTFCIGNIIGSQIFRPSDAPRYLKGLTGCAIAMAVCMVVVGAWWSYYEYTNRKRDRDFVTSGLTKEEQDYQRKLAGETDLTDIQNVHFRYTN